MQNLKNIPAGNLNSLSIKIYAQLICFIAILLLSNNLAKAGCGATGSIGESFSAQAATTAASVAVEAMVAVVTQEAAAISAAVSDGDLNECLQSNNSKCELVFQVVIKFLEKLMTPKYRMTHSMHIFRPNQVKFSQDTAKRLSKLLLAAK